MSGTVFWSNTSISTRHFVIRKVVVKEVYRHKPHYLLIILHLCAIEQEPIL